MLKLSKEAFEKVAIALECRVAKKLIDRVRRDPALQRSGADKPERGQSRVAQNGQRDVALVAEVAVKGQACIVRAKLTANRAIKPLFRWNDRIGGNQRR